MDVMASRIDRQTKDIVERIKYPYVLGNPHDLLFVNLKKTSNVDGGDTNDDTDDGIVSKIKGNLIGKGKNGIVFDVQDENIHNDLKVKYPYQNMVVKEFMKKFIDNDKILLLRQHSRPTSDHKTNHNTIKKSHQDTVMKFVCLAEQESEILIQSLLSELFSCGISPHFTLQICSFINPSSGKLFTITEKLGISNSPMASLIFLPHILEICFGNVFTDKSYSKQSNVLLQKISTCDVVNQPGYCDKNNIQKEINDIPQTYDMIMNEILNQQYTITQQGVEQIQYLSTILLIQFLHSLAVMQKYYGIQSMDMRPENILLKITLDDFEKMDYFRGQSLKKLHSINYIFPLDSDNDSDSDRDKHETIEKFARFTLPNVGFFIKFIDFGMATAHKVPSVSKEGILRDTKILPAFYHRKLSDVYNQSLSNENITKVLGTDPNKFSKGYDMDVFLWLFNDMIHQWLKKNENETIRDTNGNLPIYWLLKMLNIQRRSKDEEKNGRPQLYDTTSFGPIDALNMLYNMATKSCTHIRVSFDDDSERKIKQNLQQFICFDSTNQQTKHQYQSDYSDKSTLNLYCH